MDLSKESLKRASQNQKFIVDFYADWCKGCKKIKPILEAESEISKDIRFVYINIDEFDKEVLKKEFGVIAIPNVQFWYNGKKLDFTVGSVAEEKIVGKIEKFRIQ